MPSSRPSHIAPSSVRASVRATVLATVLSAVLVPILLALSPLVSPAWAQGPDAPGRFDCDPTGNTLCLQRGRFAVTVEFQTPFGFGGPGIPRPVTDHTGAFWFFDPDNLELMVRVVDTRAQNGHFGVFFGSVVNVTFDLAVQDNATGQVLVFQNPQGNLSGGGLALAFAADPGPGAVPPPQVLQSSPADPTTSPTTTTTTPLTPTLEAPGSPELSTQARPSTSGSPCAAATELCLQEDRFLLQVAWETSEEVSRQALPVSLLPDTGAFWFTRPADLEVFVRLLDARALNGSFWVLAGSLSQATFELRVTDTATGRVVTYLVPGGSFASIVDTHAFPDF